MDNEGDMEVLEENATDEEADDSNTDPSDEECAFNQCEIEYPLHHFQLGDQCRIN